jgi:hypothetical protein
MMETVFHLTLAAVMLVVALGVVLGKRERRNEENDIARNKVEWERKRQREREARRRRNGGSHP